MKLYVGSRNYRPAGYVTVDIDAANNPDILADIRDMSPVADGTCDEVVAGHVLEHIDWPDSFAAMAEFTRVLKPDGIVRIAVPDMAALLRMLLSGESAFHVMGLIYGLGGRTNSFEAHRYGFTPGMLVDILETLGFGAFDWWNSDLPDASNGWAPRGMDERIGMSLNLSARKLGAPSVSPRALHEELLRTPMDDFLTVVARLEGRDRGAGASVDRIVSGKLLQLMHARLVDAEQRIRYLEGRPTPEQQLAGAPPERGPVRSVLRRLAARM